MTHTSTEQPELLPCPFCGASGAEVCENTEKYIGFEWSVNCAVCDGNCGGHEDEATAVLAWNRRAPASQAQRVPLTRKQINECSRDAQIAFCMDKHPTYEVALTREVERILGITQEKQG